MTSSDLLLAGSGKGTSVPVGLMSLHAEYSANYGRWTLMRDVLEGEDVIKERGTLYLPSPSGMTDPQYEEYKARASFTGYVNRSVDAMLGLVGKKKPVLVAPEEIDELRSDITLTGVPLDAFAMNILAESFSVGRGGILVDYPTVEEEAMVLQDVEDQGLRPYFVPYTAENILDWREGRVGNRRVLTYVKLQEMFEAPFMEDSFASTSETRIRILRLTDAGCKFEVYSLNDQNNETLISSGFIYKNGDPLMYIPFFPVGPMENTMAVQRPPLLDMAFLNIHHYRASADRNHAIHYADCPTPVFIGQFVTKDGSPVTEVKLGPTTAIHLQAEGDAKFLEMTGNGINPTKELMQEYVEAMSTLGNKILATDSRAAEAAETAAIHRSGEQAILATMANNVSMAITQALKCMADFLGVEKTNISYRLPTDYLPGTMDSQTMIALIGALQARELSEQEFFEAMIAGEMIRPDKTYEEHRAEIAKMPAATALVAGAGQGTETTLAGAGSGLTPKPETKEDDSEDGMEDDTEEASQ